MQPGIALLLRDACPDLAATVHAIELAKRTGGVVHAIFSGENRPDGNGKGGKEAIKYDNTTFLARILSLATWWSEKRGVKVHMHLLENLADATLFRLCRAYRISCLVTGVGNRHDMKREASRVVRLRKRMASEDAQGHQVLWSVIIPAWHDFAFKSVITRFEKVVWQNAPAHSGRSCARHEQ